VVGQETVVGHRVTLHGCRVEDGCIIGMQATILDDVVIGEGSLVGAAALVTPGTVIPPGSLVLGAPAKVVRSLSESDRQWHRALAAKYLRLKENYLRDSLGVGPGR
jgi:carbonic anhydrase/acetyltransferase-like protein (isoleucine patch superfamily)